MGYTLYDYILIGDTLGDSIAELYRAVAPHTTVSIRATRALGRDIDDAYNLARSIRSRYTVAFPDGTEREYQRMVRLINGVVTQVPSIAPELYYTLLHFYISDINNTRYTATPYVLDYLKQPNRPADAELEIQHAVRFSDTIEELLYREMLYEMRMMQGDHYTLVLFPLYDKIRQLHLVNHIREHSDAETIDVDDKIANNVHYLLIRRYLLPPKRPVWSRRRYETLLHAWAQMIDALCDTLRSSK